MDLEDRLTVPGAEGIDLDLVLAGLGSRSYALGIDLVLEVAVVLLVGLAAGALGAGGAAVAAVALFLVTFCYPIAFEAFNGGQTVGKAIVGVAAVDIDGSPLSFLQAVIRNVVRFVDLLPGTYLVGAVSILVTDRNQRVGDLAANTLVVHRRRRGADRVAPIAPLGAAAGPIDPVAAGWDLTAISADEVAAARAFLERRNDLAPEARMELGSALAGQLAARSVGVPVDGGPEAFLERIVAAKQQLG